MWLRKNHIEYVGKWQEASAGPEWLEFDYAGPSPIFSSEAVVLTKMRRNCARLASD